MRKLTFIAGLAVGYVLGTRAGRERYEQMRKTARDLSQTQAVQSAGRNAKVAANNAANKAGQAVADRFGDRIPAMVADRIPYLNNHNTTLDDWDTRRA
ncbi:YtxH domain-containing protein [Streptacidiphilus fuscans]|uniref:YtxH domain-containing protein n=1 Tax=Streptacidiphilus fuscans TaxID=2789292 RepID=A0A931FHR9_9ACTN|nr:YtxH domain-containing protein [Streptacidiphilus fuscans]MBF9073938.1 YtxH domain-containing protein [Streptacidiphilus fuscans]